MPATNRGSSPTIKPVSKKNGFFMYSENGTGDGRTLTFSTSNLAENEKLDPKRVHDGRGCVGHNGIDRESCRNLVDSYTGNNMGRVSVDQILRRGPAV